MDTTNDTDPMIVANGINAATGDYLFPPQTEEAAAKMAEEQPPDKEQLNVLRGLFRTANQPHFGALFSIDLTKIEEGGWAIVFHVDEDSAVKAALQPLIDHRRTRINNDSIVKVLEYHDGESVPRWLARHRMGIGDIDPTKVPFYILLVGSPARIPFLFGHLLDAVYGVGRLYFDSVDKYKAYVDSIIAYETGSTVPNSRDVVFFGPQHIADKPTKLSAANLVRPLGGGVSEQPGVVDRIATSKYKLNYNAKLLSPSQSTKQALHDVFCPGENQAGPAFLFTASHGMGFPMSDPRQKAVQGALLCQDFPGVGFGPVKPEYFFAASDLPAAARVHGLICFHFACYGVGTPRDNRFSHRDGVTPPDIAPEPFFAALPQALLSHGNGGALGVIGHVERAWPNSIITTGAGVQLLPFINAISFILIGKPLGYALKDFNERYAALSTSLGALLEKKSFGLTVTDSELAASWTARNDAEAYILFGDPGAAIRPELRQ